MFYAEKSFNSKLVRLKALCNIAFAGDVDGFNSKLVRLKGGSCASYCLFGLLRFNSKLVRLKEFAAIQVLHLWEWFQFQTGSIKRGNIMKQEMIKILRSFNSKLVRLKAQFINL